MLLLTLICCLLSDINMISVCYIIDMADTLRYLLVGSGEITLENIEVMTYFMLSTVLPVANVQTYWGVMLYDAHVHLFFLQLMSRSPSEVYEILSLARLAFRTLWGWDISSLLFPFLLSFLPPPPSLVHFLFLLSFLSPPHPHLLLLIFSPFLLLLSSPLISFPFSLLPQ